MEYESDFSFTIKRLRLNQYRQFERLEVDFHPQVTVLTAPNGGGKSAIVQAMAVACAHFIYSLDVNPGMKNGFEKSDYRLVPMQNGCMIPVPEPLSLECEGVVGGEPMTWTRERRKANDSRTSYAGAQCLKAKAEELRKASMMSSADGVVTYAPMIALYDTRRLARESKLTESRSQNNVNRFNGYRDCLALGSNIKVFRRWFKNLWFSVIQERMNTRGGVVNGEVRLRIVQEAITKALKIVGWSRPYWDFEFNEIVLSNNEGKVLPYNMLSDGIQNVFTLVADLVHRAVVLNPLCADDLLQQVQGLVLIDEIDMYLHPTWQQVIVPTLLEIFPRVQFVLTTHSPQVLSTLKREQIRIIEQVADGEFEVRLPDFSPYAQEAVAALTGILNTSSTPTVPESEDLSRLGELYRSGETNEAEQLERKLVQQGIDVSQEDVNFWKFIASHKL